MRYAISIPQFDADGAFDPAGFRAYLGRAEALGFAGAWTQEQVVGTMPTLGPIETMAFAAACTERMRLGCAVFVTPLHNPVHLAKSLSTLDQLSRGRRRVADGLNRLYSYFGLTGLEPMAVSGPPEACAQGVREVADAGAELILFTPFFDEAEQMERLAAEVVPNLS